MEKWNVYDLWLNGNTKNFGGLEWVADGEHGYRTYPGTLPECLVIRLYGEGLNAVPNIGYCDGCTGAEKNMYCRKETK